MRDTSLTIFFVLSVAYSNRPSLDSAGSLNDSFIQSTHCRPSSRSPLRPPSPHTKCDDDSNDGQFHDQQYKNQAPRPCRPRSLATLIGTGLTRSTDVGCIVGGCWAQNLWMMRSHGRDESRRYFRALKAGVDGGPCAVFCPIR